MRIAPQETAYKAMGQDSDEWRAVPQTAGNLLNK
jgi:hypothetical protein